MISNAQLTGESGMHVLFGDSQSWSESYLKTSCISPTLLDSDSVKLLSIFILDRYNTWMPEYVFK